MQTSQVITITAMATLLGGCFGFKAFQPPPYEYENWDKAGSTEADIGRALLECGTGPIIDRRFSFTLNEVALSRLCMEENGFRWKNDSPWRSNICLGRTPPSACEAGTPAPHRDPDKRISSAYCHDFPRARGCQP